MGARLDLGARLQEGALDALRWGADGLVTGVVQDRSDGRVLMVGHLDAEALRATLETGDVHFHSRSRDRLWRKGETSGNTLRLVEAALDCDADALLLTVDPSGPTCHIRSRSCFDAGPSLPGVQPEAAQPSRAPGGPSPATAQGFDWLESLWTTIAERARTRPEGSHTAALLESGVNATAQKVGEEAIEVIIAAKDDAARSTAASRDALAGELADLLYHALVLCAERGLPPSRVVEVLRSRRR